MHTASDGVCQWRVSNVSFFLTYVYLLHLTSLAATKLCLPVSVSVLMYASVCVCVCVRASDRLKVRRRRGGGVAFVNKPELMYTVTFIITVWQLALLVLTWNKFPTAFLSNYNVRFNTNRSTCALKILYKPFYISFSSYITDYPYWFATC